MFLPKLSPQRRLALVVAGVALTVVLRLLADPLLGASAPLLLFVMPVLAAALLGGIAAGLAATLISLAVTDYFFIDPRGALAVERPEDMASMAVFAVEGALISAVGGAYRLSLERVRTQTDRLHRSEQRYRLIIENVRDHAIFLVSPDGALESWNTGVRDLTGYAEEEFVGRPFATVFPEGLAKEGRPQREPEHAAEQGVYHAESAGRRKDGSSFDADVTLTAVRGPDGNLQGFVGVIRDISVRKAAERKLRDSETRYRAVFEQAAVGIAEVAEDGAFRRVNPRLCRLTGYSCEELVRGHAAEDIAHPEDRAADSVRAGRLFDGKLDSYALEIRYVRRDGRSVWVLANSSAVRNGGGRTAYRLLVVQDISGRKRAEEEVRRVNAELEGRIRRRTAELNEANRRLREANSDLEAFSYSVSHDLRAPLRVMGGLADALLEDYGDRLDGRGREYAEVIVQSAGQMDALLQDLLAFGRLGRPELRLGPVSLESLTQDVLRRMAGRLSESRAEIEVRSPLPAVVAHEPVLVLLITNLLDNAAKFSRTGVPPRIQVRAERRGDSVRLWVEDNGIGIAAEHRERIFGAFERLHGADRFAGTGIGLAIVKKGIERMGGRVGVESVPDAGSRFWIELPAASDDEPVRGVARRTDADEAAFPPEHFGSAAWPVRSRGS